MQLCPYKMKLCDFQFSGYCRQRYLPNLPVLWVVVLAVVLAVLLTSLNPSQRQGQLS